MQKHGSPHAGTVQHCLDVASYGNCFVTILFAYFEEDAQGVSGQVQRHHSICINNRGVVGEFVPGVDRGDCVAFGRLDPGARRHADQGAGTTPAHREQCVASIAAGARLSRPPGPRGCRCISAAPAAVQAALSRAIASGVSGRAGWKAAGRAPLMQAWTIKSHLPVGGLVSQDPHARAFASSPQRPYPCLRQ